MEALIKFESHFDLIKLHGLVKRRFHVTTGQTMVLFANQCPSLGTITFKYELFTPPTTGEELYA